MSRPSLLNPYVQDFPAYGFRNSSLSTCSCGDSHGRIHVLQQDSASDCSHDFRLHDADVLSLCL
jgi:hypothetical protein